MSDPAPNVTPWFWLDFWPAVAGLGVLVLWTACLLVVPLWGLRHGWWVAWAYSAGCLVAWVRDGRRLLPDPFFTACLAVACAGWFARAVYYTV